MTDAAPSRDRDAEMLACIAELDLGAAERVHAKLMAAEETAEVVELGRAYQRLARSLRQTLLIKARLESLRAKAAREAAAVADEARRGRLAAHKTHISRTVEARIAAEVEDCEAADRLTTDLDAWLHDEALTDGFLEQTAAAHIARACQRLGLNTPSVGFADTSPALCGAGEEREAQISSSPEGHTSGEVSAKPTQGALPPHRAPDHPWPSSA